MSGMKALTKQTLHSVKKKSRQILQRHLTALRVFSFQGISTVILNTTEITNSLAFFKKRILTAPTLLQKNQNTVKRKRSFFFPNIIR